MVSGAFQGVSGVPRDPMGVSRGSQEVSEAFNEVSGSSLGCFRRTQQRLFFLVFFRPLRRFKGGQMDFRPILRELRGTPLRPHGSSLIRPETLLKFHLTYSCLTDYTTLNVTRNA